MSDSLHVIIDLGESHEWDVRFAENGGRLYGPRLIPLKKRPSILQCSREVAEAEALRLQAANPEGQFVVFTATLATALVEAPTHVNLNGLPLRTEKVARLLPVAEATVAA